MSTPMPTPKTPTTSLTDSERRARSRSIGVGHVVGSSLMLLLAGLVLCQHTHNHQYPPLPTIQPTPSTQPGSPPTRGRKNKGSALFRDKKGNLSGRMYLQVRSKRILKKWKPIYISISEHGVREILVIVDNGCEFLMVDDDDDIWCCVWMWFLFLLFVFDVNCCCCCCRAGQHIHHPIQLVKRGVSLQVLSSSSIYSCWQNWLVGHGGDSDGAVVDGRVVEDVEMLLLHQEPPLTRKAKRFSNLLMFLRTCLQNIP